MDISTESIQGLFVASDHEYLSLGNLEEGLIVNPQPTYRDDFDNKKSEDQAINIMNITESTEIVSVDSLTGQFVDIVAEIGSLSDHNYSNAVSVQKSATNGQLASLVQKNASHKCGYCDKLCVSLTALQRHVRSHTKEQPFKCQICEKCFSQQSNLWKHVKIHTGDKPFTCPQCKKQFSQRANMQKHQLVHSGIKPYDCPYCIKVFSQLANRDKHVQLHLGTRPYKCQYCDRSFSQRANMVKHQHVHEGVKPFNCDICRASFTQQNHLKKHLALHTGEKSYICLDCGKTYIQQINLFKHKLHCTKQMDQTFENLLDPDTNSNFTIIQLDGSENSYYINEHNEFIKLEQNWDLLEIVEEGDSNQSSFSGSA